MFIAIYTFKTIAGKEDQFIQAWEELTKLIIQYENSLGSRLHKKEDNFYVAYAQWPDKDTWANSGDNLPDSADEFRQLMKASCIEIKAEHELVVLSDLLKTKAH